MDITILCILVGIGSFVLGFLTFYICRRIYNWRRCYGSSVQADGEWKLIDIYRSLPSGDRKLLKQYAKKLMSEWYKRAYERFEPEEYKLEGTYIHYTVIDPNQFEK